MCWLLVINGVCYQLISMPVYGEIGTDRWTDRFLDDQCLILVMLISTMVTY